MFAGKWCTKNTTKNASTIKLDEEKALLGRFNFEIYIYTHKCSNMQLELLKLSSCQEDMQLEGVVFKGKHVVF